MPRCPECGAEIDYLINISEERITYRLYSTGGFEKEDSDLLYDLGYRCPKCGEVLFEDFWEAYQFLNRTENDVQAWE